MRGHIFVYSLTDFPDFTFVNPILLFSTFFYSHISIALLEIPARNLHTFPLGVSTLLSDHHRNTNINTGHLTNLEKKIKPAPLYPGVVLHTRG